ncbi:MAG: hypothetical protein K1X28_04560 [Parachlamydiales bacterium]|nr:hypothetical protein [Parachlamydiales bacterium]
MTTAVKQNIFSQLASYKELTGIAFERGTYHRIAGEILARQKWFMDHPSSIQYLTPKARQYHQIFDLAKSQLESRELEKTLAMLRNSHILFTNAFIEEFERVYPESPDVVNVKYKKTIELFADVIQANFTKEEIKELNLLIFARTPMLAIEDLLQHPEKEIPEIFNAGEIETLRKTPGKISLKKVIAAPKTMMTAIFRETFKKFS